MPAEVKYLDNKIGFSLAAVGNISKKDLLAAIKDFYQSENFTINRYGIIECSCTLKDILTNSDVIAIAELSKKASKITPYRIVAVVSRSDVVFGLSRMWEILAEKTNWDTRVFRSRSDAEEWLKIKALEKFNIDISLT